MTKPKTFLFATAAGLLAIACSAAAPTSAPTNAPPTPVATKSPTPSSTPVTPVSVTSAAQAAALVFASDPRWAAMAPQRSDIVGASKWFEASEDASGFGVVITAGSGDCMAGCIEQHRWLYHVDRDGAVTLTGEDGDDVEVEAPPASSDGSEVRIKLTAGPVCPVERDPPDPACAPRAVANASVTLYASDGSEIASAPTSADGVVSFEVDGGAYYVVAHPVEGLLVAPQPQAFAVPGGSQLELVMAYDTGIR